LLAQSKLLALLANPLRDNMAPTLALGLLAGFAFLRCTTAMRALAGTEDALDLDDGNNPFDWLRGHKQCAATTGNWAQAGQLLTAADLARPARPGSAAAQPGCTSGSRSAFGDEKSGVELSSDGRFVYAPGVDRGSGSGVLLCGLEAMPKLEYVYTQGLEGCMAIAILGTERGSGRTDLFFAHSRSWSNFGVSGINERDPETRSVVPRFKTVEVPEADPLRAAQRFVSSHDNLNVFFGSGVHPGLGYSTEQEANFLSNILGVWVHSDRYHNAALREDLAFSVRMKAWVPMSDESGLTADDEKNGMRKVRMFTAEERASQLYKDAGLLEKTPAWTPDSGVLQAIGQQTLSAADLLHCAQLLRAYAAGDFDTVNSLHEGDIGKNKDAANRAFGDMKAKGLKGMAVDLMQVSMQSRFGRHLIESPERELGIHPAGK